MKSARKCVKVREFTDCAADVVHHRVVDLIDLMRVWRADILLALLGPSASGFQGFRPFRLPQLAPTCGPAAVLRRVSLHDEDVRLRSQIPRLAPPRARVAHRSG